MPNKVIQTTAQKYIYGKDERITVHLQKLGSIFKIKSKPKPKLNK